MVLATILAALVLTSSDQVKHQPMFDTLFPQPTGKNGFEDYIRASDMLLSKPARELFDALIMSRRRLKGNPASQYAGQNYLALCRKGWDAFGDMYVAIETGNKKPIVDPRTKIFVFMEQPERWWFDQVADLIGDLAYARFSRGESKVGTNMLCQALLFLRNTVRPASILGGPPPFFGRLERSRPIFERLDTHLSQLSREDARMIVQFANDMLARPPVAREMFALDRQLHQDFLDALARCDWEMVSRYWYDGEAGSHMDDVKFVKDALSKLSPTDYDKLVRRMTQIAEKWFAEAAAVLAKPESDWSIEDMHSDDPLEQKLCREFGHYKWAESALEQTQLRLMRLHGLIIGYRWENNQLPVDLEALNAPEAILDPLAKTQFIYKPSPGGGYELYSRGGNAYGRIDLKYIKGA